MIGNSYSWGIAEICDMISKGTITFENPIQRPAGQWKKENESLLIDSILQSFVIPPIYTIGDTRINAKGKKIKINDVIDGLQRLTIISSFLADKWRLTKLKPITLRTTGEEFDISEKLFSELDKSVQRAIENYSLAFNITELEESDSRRGIAQDIFCRLNNYTSVSKEHMAWASAKENVQDFVYNIIRNHKLFTDIAHFSPSKVKKSDREMTILQSILLVSNLNYSTFSANNVKKFFVNTDISEETLKLTDKVFSDIVKAFPKHNMKVSKINIPILSYIFANTLEVDKKNVINSLQKYFNKDIRKGDKYKSFCGTGNTEKINIKGRINTLLEICDTKLNQAAK